MHFTKTLGALALAAVAAAQSTSLFFTNTAFSLAAGKPFTITYASSDLSQPATILLRKGLSGQLTTIETITSDATGGSFTFTPATTLAPADDYAFEITQGSQSNYSKQFSITGGTGTSTSAPGYYSASMSSSMSSVMSSMVASYNSTVATSTPAVYGTGSAPYPTASASGYVPMHRNTTFSSATIRATNTGFSPSAAATSSVSTNAATSVKSHLALILGLVGAIVYIN